MNIKTFKILKKRKFKRYKKLDTYLKQGIDPYDHCQKKGANRHSKDEINLHLKSLKRYHQHLKQPGKKYYCYDEYEFSQDTVEAHLKAHNPLDYTHYTLRPDSLYHLNTLDIDPMRRILIQNYQPVTDFLQIFIPSTFWDHGSSGQTLNYYYWTYNGNLYEKVLNHPDNLFFDYDGDIYCYFINTMKDILAAGLQVILFHEFPDIFLENIYPEVTEYEYFIKTTTKNKVDTGTGEIKEYQSHKTIFQELKKNAHMMKLPHPKTDLQKENLLNLPVTNLEDILLNILRYIQVSGNNLSFSSYFPEMNSQLTDIAFLLLNKVQVIFSSLCSENILELKTLQAAHSEISSLRSELLHALNHVPVEETISGDEIPNNNNLYLLYRYISPRFNVESENKVFQAINSDPDAYQRSIKFLHYLCWKLYTTEKRLPEEEEYIDLYRQFIGTGSEDQYDRRRLQYVYRKGIVLFDPEKVKKSLPYVVGEYILKLKSEISPEEIIQVRDNESSYDRPITYEDIDVGAGWIFHSLTNQNYLEEKKNSQKEFTVPANSLVGFQNALNDRGLVQKRGTKGKAKAIREILLHLGWIEYLDKDFCFIEHRAMRYILTKKHPRYKEFVQVFGQDEIDKWNQWKDERKESVNRKRA